MRLVVALLFLVLNLVGISTAHAQYQRVCGLGAGCDQGDAYADCQAHVAALQAGQAPFGNWSSGGCKGPFTHDFLNDRYDSWYRLTSDVSDRPGQSFYYARAQACSTRPNEYNWCSTAECGADQSGTVCSQGCKYVLTVGVGDPSYYGADGSTCEVGPAPILDTDQDGVPDTEDAFPNDPNESADSDGDGVGDNADFAPNDPTDGKDMEGEEDGDDEGDNQASGGGDCNAPPSCTGDGIQCAQLHQQWMIRCKGATVTGSPETCNTGYTCSGDAAQCAQIALLRKTACSDVISGNVDTDGDGFGVGDKANLGAIKDALTGSSQGDAGPEGNAGDSWAAPGTDDGPDDSGFGWSRGCPQSPTFAVFGETYTLNIQPACDWISLGGLIVLGMAALGAIRILGGGIS